MIAIVSCQVNQKQSEKTNQTNSEKWFEEGAWKQGWNVSADESVDKIEFQKIYAKNPERWEKAFSFLATTDLENIEPGKYKLEGDSLFANVDQYETRDEKDTRFESHRKYADIQYLISGKEYMGIVPLSKMQEVTAPYNGEKDIAFYNYSESNYRLADSTRFFIFLPGDAHRPCRKVDENESVKKVVVKVEID